MRVKLINSGKILLSFLIMAAMIFPTVLADSVTASAEVSDDYIKIYFKNPGWSLVNVHFWCTEYGIESKWPGCRITETESTAYEISGDKTVITKYNTTENRYEVYLKSEYQWDGIIFDSMAIGDSSKIGTNRTSNIGNLSVNDGNTWVLDGTGGHWLEQRASAPYIAGDRFSPNGWDEPFQQMIDGGNYYYYNSDVLSDGQTSVNFKVIDRNTWNSAVSPPSGTKYLNGVTNKNINAVLQEITTGNKKEQATLNDSDKYDRIQIRMDKSSGDIYAVGMKAPIVEAAPRIRFSVPYDSWQRDFVMSETDEYYHCAIPTVNAQIYIYNKDNSDVSGEGYAGIDTLDEDYVSKNINVEFQNIDGTDYKNVKVTSAENAGSEIDVRVDKETGLIYGVSGDVGSPKYSQAISISAKTESESAFSTYDMLSDENSRYYTFTFNSSSVEMDFLYNAVSVTNELNYNAAESENRGINLFKKDGSNTYTAEIIDKDNCDQIKVYADKYIGTVFAEAIKSDIDPDENTQYYLEGRFICEDSNGTSVSVDNKAWSDTSASIKLSQTENAGVYKFVTNSTVSELTVSDGAPYYFFVREGTKYPKSVTGKYYSPSGNTSLKNILPGEPVDVTGGTSCNGGLYFNDKNNNSGKVTIWFDISDSDKPYVYYTLRYDGITAKAMYSAGTENFADYSGAVPVIEPEGSVELPSGTKVSAVPTVKEDGREYSFTRWTSENGTGKFEDSSSPETAFYPSADNEKLIAQYKLTYNITCESSEHGEIKADSGKAAVGEMYTINITPDDGYTLTSLTVNGEEKINDTSGRTKYTAEMPNEPVTVKAVFEAENEVYFYAAVPKNWVEHTPSHKEINVVADGVKLEAVKIFDDTVKLYNPNSNIALLNGKEFYVNMFKAEQHAKILIANPENADGTVDANCYGHKILSGELQAGACYYYYSASQKNYNGIVNAMTVNSVKCLTENPAKDTPVELSVDISDCNGKTAGQESYTVEYDVRDSKGNSYSVTNNTFTPKEYGVYTVSAWAAYGDAKSNTAQCTVNVEGGEPVNTELTVEFRYYDRDSKNSMEISDSETVLSVTQNIAEEGIEKTVINAYTSVQDKIKKNMNIMSEYYFYTSQSAALEGIKSQNNYHAVKRDDKGNIVRNEYGIAQYYTYGECYSDSELKLHLNGYGYIGSWDEWVVYYSGDNVIDESAAYANPNSVTKVVIHGFNNPRVYHVNMSFAGDESSGSVVCVDEKKALYAVNDGSKQIYDAFYNMSLSADADYTNGGYLSNFDISEYYGNEEMPTAARTVKDSNSNEYVFDGWYDTTDGSLVKISSDLSFTNRVINNMSVTAVYRHSEDSEKEPAVTVTKSDTEKFRENDVEKVRINTVMNAFDCESIENSAVIYVRLKASENSDWADEYSNIDMDSLRENIIEILKEYDGGTGRRNTDIDVSVIDVGDSGKASVISDCYKVVSDKNEVNVQEFKIALNNKNRVQFSIAFTAQSACDNGANSAILTFAAVKSGGEWILSENYIPYINTGDTGR